MDPMSVTLGGVVAGLIAKAVDAAGDKLVGGAAATIGRLITKVRDRFRDEDDEPAEATLAKVEEVPDSPRLVQALADMIDRHAEDPAFRTELEALIDEAQRSGVSVSSVSQTATGDQNVQMGAVSSSQIAVNIDKPQTRPTPRT